MEGLKNDYSNDIQEIQLIKPARKLPVGIKSVLFSSYTPSFNLIQIYELYQPIILGMRISVKTAIF